MANQIIIGRNPVYEHIKTNKKHKNDMLYINKKAHGKVINDIKRAAKAKHFQITYCGKADLDKISNLNHQGVILSVHAQDHIKKVTIDAEELLEKVAEKKGVLVLLDQLTDPHNIGSIIRSTEALGGDGLITMKHNSPEINETIVKTSAGATSHLPIATIANAATFIDKAKEKDFWVIGTTDHATKEIDEITDVRPAMVVIGNEGKGMRRLTEEKCDFLIKIPLKGNISSLNASVAAGIVLYEILK